MKNVLSLRMFQKDVRFQISFIAMAKKRSSGCLGRREQAPKLEHIGTEAGAHRLVNLRRSCRSDRENVKHASATTMQPRAERLQLSVSVHLQCAQLQPRGAGGAGAPDTLTHQRSEQHHPCAFGTPDFTSGSGCFGEDGNWSSAS